MAAAQKVVEEISSKGLLEQEGMKSKLEEIKKEATIIRYSFKN
jgi:hypothetical protein